MKLLTSNQRHTITTLLNCREVLGSECRILIREILFGDSPKDTILEKSREEDRRIIKEMRDRESLRSNCLIQYDEACYWKDKFLKNQKDDRQKRRKNTSG